METKICCDCGLEKPVDKFCAIRKKDNIVTCRVNFCNPCAWIRRKKNNTPSNYYYAKNPAAWNAYQKAYAKRKRAEKKLQKSVTDFCNKK